MNAPGITRHRRPFLAPIWIAALAALVAGTVLFVAVRLAAFHLTTVSTVIVLRHAEKATTPSADPALSAPGEARAQRLAQMFGTPGAAGAIRTIISSDTTRARATVAPLAARLGLGVEVLGAGDVPGILRRVHDLGHGSTTLVVGHGNTVPQIISGLTGGRVAVSVGEGDFGTLFIVTVSDFGPPRVLQLAY